MATSKPRSRPSSESSLAASAFALASIGDPWPAADDPTIGKPDIYNGGTPLIIGRLSDYKVAATKSYVIDHAAGLPRIDWAVYLWFKVAGAKRPTSRTRVWFVGDLMTAAGTMRASGMRLLDIGAQHRSQYVVLRAVLRDNTGKITGVDYSAQLSFTYLERDAAGLPTHRSAAYQAHTLPAFSTGKNQTAPEWEDFWLVRPTGAFWPGHGCEVEYTLRSVNDNCTLQALYYATEHLPGVGVAQPEDGGTPPGDPSELD